MKKVIAFIKNSLKKRKTFSSLFSEAIAEGIRDTYKEMGNSSNDKNESEDVFQLKNKK
jgi:hypothetical protein